MNRIALVCLFALFGLLAARVAAVAADVSPQRFEKEIQAFEESDRAKRPPEAAILFTGASGIKRWKTLQEDFPDQKVINRGFGGCHMADVVYYADRIVIPYKPRLIVVQAGGNDLNSGKTPQQVAEDFQALFEKVRAKLPDTRIVYMSIGPSPARWSQVEQQKTANRLIQEIISKGKNLDYIDSFAAFLGPDGKPREELFIADRLHHSAEGYKLRTSLVKPHLP